MADDIHDLNKNTPAQTPAGNGTESSDAERAHRRVEREAMKGAKRAEELEKRDGRDEFSNVGPV